MTPGGGLVGVVLAGGRSSRMGRDKTRLLVGNRDLLARSAGLLAQVAGRVVVQGRDPAPHGLDMDWLPDDTPGMGPIGGIVTALRRLQRPCLILACDLPCMDRATLERLAAEYGRPGPEALMTTYRQAETGFIESLVAVYSPACLQPLEDALAQGRRKLSAIVPRPQRREIVYTRAEAGPFVNLNFPEDLDGLSAFVKEPVAWPASV